MKKKILLIILVLLQASTLKVVAYNWEYLPKTNNYFDPENYRLEGELYFWSFTCLHPFRIKENTVYSLTSISYTEYFFENYTIIFYNQNYEEIKRNPSTRKLKYRGYGVMEISFTTPVGAHYLSLDFSIDHEPTAS